MTQKDTRAVSVGSPARLNEAKIDPGKRWAIALLRTFKLKQTQ